MHDSFEDFMLRRAAASDSYIRGDAAPLEALVTDEDPATFLAPSGDVTAGADAAARAQVSGASAFGPASVGRFEVLHQGSCGDLGYWTGRQIATMDITGRVDPIPMTLRVTELFRREGGAWKLFHRHADIVKPVLQD